MRLFHKSWSWAIIFSTFFLLTACTEKVDTEDSEQDELEEVMEDGEEAPEGRDNSEVRPSPNASVQQNIGTDIVSITYGRPGVKNRVIFGELVPFDEVWRAGANEATVFHFSSDVKIEGTTVPAGEYAFFVIPRENDTWTVILNSESGQWGAYDYNEDNDVLRFDVTAENVDQTEWLQYSFVNLSDTSAVVSLSWDTKQISFAIESV